MPQNQTVITEENLAFAERVGIMVDELGLSLNRFAQNIGATSTTMNNARSGKKPFGKRVAQLIESKYGYAVEWILFGRGAKMVDQFGNIKGAGQLPGAVYAGELPGAEVPFIRVRDRIGFTFSDFTSKVQDRAFEMIRVFTLTQQTGAIVVEVDGDDLGEILIPSTKVLAVDVKENDWAMQSSGLYAIATESQLLLKRIIDNRLREEDPRLVLASDKSGRGRIEVRREEIKAIWKGTEIVGRPID